jgi:hypothetical protein
MATVFEDCTTEDQHSVVRFLLWADGLNAKDNHKEIFLVYGRKCLSCKAVATFEKFSQERSKAADDAHPGAKVAETTVRILLRGEFGRTGKAMGHVYQCRWRICREIIVYPRFKRHTFYVLYPIVTYLLTLPRINENSETVHTSLLQIKNLNQKVILSMCHEDVLTNGGIAPLFLTLTLHGSGQLHASATFPPT